jgi:CheY-like chemotaxis protein
MVAREWSVHLLEPNKFEAKLVLDLLRNAGVEKIQVMNDGDEAVERLRLAHPAQLILVTLDCPALDALDWTRRFRRDMVIPCRRAPIFLMTKALTRAVAENCRHAGANAIIGKPTSSAALTNTIKKVLANPRPFIDAAGYVGPCRRAGIVTTHSPHHRRRSDKGEAAAAPAAAVVERR